MTAPVEPLTLTCEQAAQRIGAAVTADWLKRRAMRGEIPHTRSGKGRGRSGRIAFTDAHLTEILRIIEQRPTAPQNDGTPQPAEFGSVVSRGRRG